MLATGGTIACRQTDRGLAPALSGEELLHFVPRLREICRITVRTPLCVDSTDMTAAQRMEVARMVWDSRAQYDGFVVTQGTDTLAYTAALLSHVLRNFAKPIVVTGAMHPIGEHHSDAEGNLLGAFCTACERYPGVGVAVHGQIIRGTNIVKMDSHAVRAFCSVNAPDDGRFSATGEVTLDYAPEPKGDPAFVSSLDTAVALIKLTPDFDAEMLHFARRYPAVLIEAFGAGGLPMRLEKTVQELIAGGTRVYLTTQCRSGGVDLSRYRVGQRAEALGVVGLGNRTTEDALAAIQCGEL